MTRTRRNRQRGATAAAPFLQPFNYQAQKWPDERTSQSAVVTSRQHWVGNAFNGNGATTTNHNFAILISTNPEIGWFICNSNDGSSTLSDLNATGTSYFGRLSVPNLGSIKASPGLIRCTGLGVRVTYEGTELQRSGKIFAGIAKQVYTPKVVSTTGTLLSPLSAITTFRSTATAVSDLQNVLTNLSVARVTDGTFECAWRPSKIPQYMTINNSDGGAQLNTSAGVSPSDGAETILNRPAGDQGVEAGQSWLVIGVEGDTTATASATGNPFSLDFIWHWEYIPSDVVTSIVTIGPSPFLPMELAAIMNNLELGPTARVSDTLAVDDSRVYSRVPPERGDYGEVAKKASNLLLRGLQAYANSRAPARGRRTQARITE